MHCQLCGVLQLLRSRHLCVHTKPGSGSMSFGKLLESSRPVAELSLPGRRWPPCADCEQRFGFRVGNVGCMDVRRLKSEKEPSLSYKHGVVLVACGVFFAGSVLPSRSCNPFGVPSSLWFAQRSELRAPWGFKSFGADSVAFRRLDFRGWSFSEGDELLEWSWDAGEGMWHLKYWRKIWMSSWDKQPKIPSPWRSKADFRQVCVLYLLISLLFKAVLVP